MERLSRPRFPPLDVHFWLLLSCSCRPLHSLVLFTVAPFVLQAEVDLMSEVIQLSSMREPMRQQAYRQLCAQLLKLQQVKDEGGQGSSADLTHMLVSLQGQPGPRLIIRGHHHGMKCMGLSMDDDPDWLG